MLVNGKAKTSTKYFKTQVGIKGSRQHDLGFDTSVNSLNELRQGEELMVSDVSLDAALNDCRLSLSF